MRMNKLMLIVLLLAFTLSFQTSKNRVQFFSCSQITVENTEVQTNKWQKASLADFASIHSVGAKRLIGLSVVLVLSYALFSVLSHKSKKVTEDPSGIVESDEHRKERIKAYVASIEMKPEDQLTAEDWNLRGCDALYQDRWDEALNLFQKSAELDSNNYETYKNIGLVWLELAIIRSDESLYNECIDALSRSIELNPNVALTNRYMGLALSNLARLTSNESLYQESIQAFDRAIELDHENIRAYSDKQAALTSLAKLKSDEA